MKPYSKYCVFIIIAIGFVSCMCNNTLSENPVLTQDNYLKYDTVTVIYTRIDDPWECYKFVAITPDMFKRHYADDLKGMKIWDSTFISKLTDRIEQRDSTIDDKFGIDTWILLYLKHAKSTKVDTLAIGEWNWLNGKKWIDFGVVQIVADKIIKHDKEWAELVSPFYTGDHWKDPFEVAAEEARARQGIPTDSQ